MNAEDAAVGAGEGRGEKRGQLSEPVSIQPTASAPTPAVDTEPSSTQHRMCLNPSVPASCGPPGLSISTAMGDSVVSMETVSGDRMHLCEGWR